MIGSSTHIAFTTGEVELVLLEFALILLDTVGIFIRGIGIAGVEAAERVDSAKSAELGLAMDGKGKLETFWRRLRKCSFSNADRLRFLIDSAFVTDVDGIG